ncbi:MAG: hypothetical protein N4A54_10005 [Peptostreptococcaceae bacterium]|jgi:hypothetical protein|nr:hypothetical protein [Peptostreptococcaceae bacterium]
MNSLKINILQEREIYLNDKKIEFKYEKLKGILYIVAIKKKISKNEVAKILWGNLKDPRKNLRNAIYEINRMHMEPIIKRNKDYLLFDDGMNVEFDFDILINDIHLIFSMLKKRNFSDYKIPNEDVFNDYFLEMFNDLKKKLINLILKNLDIYSLNQVEFLKQILLELDDLNEYIYEELEDYYKKNDYTKNELEIKSLKNRIFKKEESKDEFEKIYKENLFKLYSRDDLFSDILNEYYSFKNDNLFNNIIIKSEFGSGKTKFLNSFYQYIKKEETNIFKLNLLNDDSEYYIFEYIIYKLNKAKSYKINSRIDRLLLEYNVRFLDVKFNGLHKMFTKNRLRSFITEFFCQFLKDEKIVILIDNLEFVSKESLDLLNELILKFEDNIFLVSTTSAYYLQHINYFIKKSSSLDNFKELYMDKFDESQVFNLLDFLNIQANEDELRILYKEYDGNLNFIIKSLNNKNHINEYMNYLFYFNDKEENEFLKKLSVFDKNININVLNKYLDFKKEDKISVLISKFHKLRILKVESNFCELNFINDKIKNIIYETIPQEDRKLYHNNLAQILSEEKNISNHEKIIFHYKKGEEYKKELEEKLDYLKKYLDFYNEVYPIFNNDKIITTEPLKKRKILKILNDIKNLFLLKKNSNEDDLKKEYYHILSRFYINEGEYIVGINNAQKLINLSQDTKDDRYLVKGYKQLIFSYIQLHREEEMEFYIDMSLKIAMNNKFEEELASLYRLKGLNLIMKGEYKESKSYLLKSINLFKELNIDNKKYIANISACYNYLGDLNKYNTDYKKAISHYKKAIDLLGDYKEYKTMALLYKNIGICYFELKEYKLSLDAFLLSLDNYDNTYFKWNKGISLCYSAYLKIKLDNDLKIAKSFLIEAKKIIDEMKNPYEKGILKKIKMQIRILMDKDENIKDYFANYIKKDIIEYCDESLNYLNDIKEAYEIPYLKKIKEKYS